MTGIWFRQGIGSQGQGRAGLVPTVGLRVACVTAEIVPLVLGKQPCLKDETYVKNCFGFWARTRCLAEHRRLQVGTLALCWCCGASAPVLLRIGDFTVTSDNGDVTSLAWLDINT